MDVNNNYLTREQIYANRVLHLNTKYLGNGNPDNIGRYAGQMDKDHLDADPYLNKLIRVKTYSIQKYDSPNVSGGKLGKVLVGNILGKLYEKKTVNGKTFYHTNYGGWVLMDPKNWIITDLTPSKPIVLTPMQKIQLASVSGDAQTSAINAGVTALSEGSKVVVTKVTDFLGKFKWVIVGLVVVVLVVSLNKITK